MAFTNPESGYRPGEYREHPGRLGEWVFGEPVMDGRNCKVAGYAISHDHEPAVWDYQGKMWTCPGQGRGAFAAPITEADAWLALLAGAEGTDGK